jgi:GNAT superfamily N-acetyltransferase
VDALKPNEIQPTLDLAQATGLYTPAQLELIRDRCTGFANGKRVDDYEVLVSRRGAKVEGFLIFRKRTLTEAAFEISHLGSYDPSQIAPLLNTLKAEVRNRAGKLIFAELPDLAPWWPILALLQNAGYSLAGETPDLYAPGSGTKHYALHLDGSSQSQPQPPPLASNTQIAGSSQPSSTIAPSVVPTTRDHRSAILEITATTSVFGKDDQQIVQELLDLYLGKGLSEGYYFLSCLDGNDVIAYTCFGPRPSTIGTYDLYWICTDTRRRQHGAGRKLMAEVEAQVLERGGYLVVLETSDTLAFTPTRKFYEALGYARIVHIVRFYSDTDGLVVFAKYLRPVG